jgi:hypothetical protein
MKRILKKFNNNFFLRVGLGSMLLYTGYSTVTKPLVREDVWVALPAAVVDFLNFIEFQTALQVLGIVEILLAVGLLLWFLPRRLVFWVSLLVALENFLLLLLFGLSVESAPLLGVLAAAVATVLTYRKQW